MKNCLHLKNKRLYPLKRMLEEVRQKQKPGFGTDRLHSKITNWRALIFFTGTKLSFYQFL